MCEKVCFNCICPACRGNDANRKGTSIQKVSNEDKAKSEALLKAAEQRSDSIWKLVLPIVQDQAKHGRPYIPWAARPTDLPSGRNSCFLRVQWVAVSMLSADVVVK